MPDPTDGPLDASQEGRTYASPPDSHASASSSASAYPIAPILDGRYTSIPPISRGIEEVNFSLRNMNNLSDQRTLSSMTRSIHELGSSCYGADLSDHQWISDGSYLTGPEVMLPLEDSCTSSQGKDSNLLRCDKEF